MTIDLNVLANNRDALLLAEVTALLHDIGKLSSQFVDQMSRQPSAIPGGFEHENAIEKIDGFVDAQFASALKSTKLRDLLRLNSIPKQEQIGQILDLILHHDKARHSAFLVRLLNRCDGADSGADKGTTRDQGLPKEAKQPFDNTLIASAFGKEAPDVRIDTAKIDTTRRKLSQKVGRRLDVFFGNPEQERSRILRLINIAYRCGLGETRRSANDVTLWDHSFSVATLYKTSLATFLLYNSLDIDHLHWRLLHVNFDVLALYAKAVKIADLLGYQHVVDEACEAVKKLVEEEYPLGNEIYRDTSGIYFTFPDLDLPADLAQEIRRRVEEVEMELAPRIAVTVGDGATATEQLKGVLGKARKEALQELAQPFDSQNLSTCWQQQWETVGDGNRELCPVCRLRPKREEDDVCETCENRRRSRIAAWKENPSQTIWMDEIADHNDRVALIVGKFGLDNWLSGDLVQTMLVRADPNNPGGCIPKNPSPARLRRVWETCRRFWTETVEQEILAKHVYSQGDALRCARRLIIPDQKTGWRENVPYDGTVDGKAISLLWRKEAQHFLTISNLQLSGEIKPGQVIRLDDPDNPRRQFTITVRETRPVSDAMGAYAPYLPLLASPDQFLALVPAAEALEIAKDISEQYQEQFGKVQNRLPLFLGIVFFPRKMPLMAVMDTARRMLEGAKPEEKTWQAWQIECSRPSEDPQKRYLRLSRGQARIVYEVPVKMGDNQTDDHWYPYFFFQGDPAECPLRFQHQHNGRWLIHVKDLREGDTAFVTPSRFAYLFLESTAQRFRFDPQQDVMLLGELTRLTEMWKAICESPEMSDTKLQAIHALFESKLREWQLGEPTSVHPITDKTFYHLVETTLRRDKVQGIPVEYVLNGRFRRCVDLHLHILKRRVSDEKKQEEQHEQQTV